MPLNKPLHIVCLDAPSPPDYGGAMEMYYKLDALAQAGAHLLLHYFAYRGGRGSRGLKNFCKEIWPYRRKPFFASLSLQPYIVSSRINRQLIQRLNQDEAPVLLEGIHCTGIIPYLKPANRKIVVRLHNDEAAYYHSLARAERNPFKRLYFEAESRLLHRYQKRLPSAPLYVSLSQTDRSIFADQYGLPRVHFLPAFLPWQQVQCKEGFGSYCLYQGNLSVSENEQAAGWLVEQVFASTSIPFVIAGKNTSSRFRRLIQPYPHIQLIENPDERSMQQLIADAHIHLLPSCNKTGVKFKLLHALLNGRYCVTNKQAAAGSGVENLVVLAETAEAYRQAVAQLMQQPFTSEEKNKRKDILRLYNNAENAAQLIKWIS